MGVRLAGGALAAMQSLTTARSQPLSTRVEERQTSPDITTAIQAARPVDLSVHTRVSVTPAVPPTGASVGTFSKTALVVDDTSTNRLLLARKLRRLGFTTVHEAVDGVDALEQWVKLQATDSLPDVCFIDHNMPRMGGEELVRMLRTTWNYTRPLIGVTGDALQEDRQAFLASGLDVILCKPCTNESLLQALQQFGLHEKLHPQ
jgi:two-component system chemotaxis response regulator CheY